jgi:PAS domain S-box-containing protein
MTTWKLIPRILAGCAILLSALSGSDIAFADNHRPLSSADQRPPLTVTAGYPRQWPPQYSTTPNGDPEGFAIDVLNAIAAQAGVVVRYQAFDNFPKAIDALRNNKVDLIPNVGIIPARREYALFTAPVETFNVSTFVRATTQGINSLDDLSGRKVGVVQENVGGRLIRNRKDIEAVVFNSVQESLFELIAGSIDAVIYPEPVFLQHAEKVGIEAKIRIAGKPLREIRRGIAVRTDYPALLQRLQPAVDAFVSSKQYQEIYTKWYGSPQPYWTKQIILKGAGIAAILALALVLIWRFMSISALNRKLKLEMKEREESEKALMLSQESLAVAQRIATLGSWKYDIKNKTTSNRSDEYFRIMGQDPSRDDMLFEKNIKFIHPEDRDRVYDALEKSISTNTPYNIEHRIIRPDGEVRYVHKRGEIQLDADGNPEFLDGTMFDITERKLAEERLTDAIESINEGFALYDSDDRLVLFNSKYPESFPEIKSKIHPGVTYEELLRHSIKAGLYPDEVNRESEFIRDRVERHQRGIGSLEVKVSDDRWMLLSDRRTKTGEIVGIRTDITDLKKREEALILSQESLAVAQRIAHMGNWEWEVGSKTHSWSDEVFRIFGYSPQEFTPTFEKAIEIVHPDDRARVRKAVADSLNSHKEYQIEHRIVLPDGSERHVLKQGETVFDNQGNPVRLIGTVLDITERNQAEQKIHDLNEDLENRVEKRTKELKEARNRAEEANSAKSGFLSNMSHELRTPMNAILGFTQLLTIGNETNLSPKQKEYLDHILTSGNHLLELINEVLDLSKIESGSSALSISEVLPTEVFNTCITQIHPIAAKYGVEDISFTCKSEIPEIYADEFRLKQVLTNLLTNAAKYNKPGGSIVCGCDKTESGMLRVAISDTGIGIPEGRMTELFQPFNRLDAENSGIEGTGVGLTITKKLVEMMGGSIGVDSVSGEGSTFWFDLPLTEKGKTQGIEADDKYDASEPELTPSDRRTLLYIEDSPSSLRLMEEVMEGVEDIKMVSARTAELGLDMAKTMMPDIIVMDIMLPGIDGYEALKHIQSSKLTNHIPVIALSAYAMEPDIEKGMEAGFYSYLTKPIDIRKTINVIRDVLGDDPMNVVTIPTKG